MESKIRIATLADISGIIEVHYKSVHFLCNRHYTLRQMEAWTAKHATVEGRRKWENKIKHGEVLVLEHENSIAGFIHYRLSDGDEAYLNALYLLPAVVNKGFGIRLLDEMKKRLGGNVKTISTHSTKNAISFYQRAGFTRCGCEVIVEMENVGVECYPMELRKLSR